MLSLAARMLRHRIGSALATLIALATGVMILMSMGVLVESGLRNRLTPQRYAAADVVLAHRDITFTGKDLDGDTTSTTVVLPEGGTGPVTLVGQLRGVPGVATVVADVSIPVVPLAAGTVPAVGHGWSSAALTPYRMVAGGPPRPDAEIGLGPRPAARGRGALRPGRRARRAGGGPPR